jgi:hypothetical protein
MTRYRAILAARDCVNVDGALSNLSGTGHLEQLLVFGQGVGECVTVGHDAQAASPNGTDE